ncbi:hypothetical protein BN903_339 [Halorubrum sp. AJ67]|nr:hypothetical protein BN903_339 [Halorubrum sp. AJ67]
MTCGTGSDTRASRRQNASTTTSTGCSSSTRDHYSKSLDLSDFPFL